MSSFCCWCKLGFGKLNIVGYIGCVTEGEIFLGTFSVTPTQPCNVHRQPRETYLYHLIVSTLTSAVIIIIFLAFLRKLQYNSHLRGVVRGTWNPRASWTELFHVVRAASMSFFFFIYLGEARRILDEKTGKNYDFELELRVINRSERQRRPWWPVINTNTEKTFLAPRRDIQKCTRYINTYDMRRKIQSSKTCELTLAYTHTYTRLMCENI